MPARLHPCAALVGALLGCSEPPAPTPDLSRPRDAAAEPADLTQPPKDLTAPPDLLLPDLRPLPTLTGVPDCTVETVNATTLFNQAIVGRCTARYCHGTADPIGNFSFDSVAKLRAVWVGRPAGQARMAFITPGSLDRSYVMWKLLDQQARVAEPEMAGSRMPLPPLAALPQAELCLFINWIRGGAS